MTRLSYLVAYGPQTSIRLVVPAMGSFRVGRSLNSDCVLLEPDIAESHLTLFLGPELGVRAHAPDTAILLADEESERPLRPEKTVDLGPDERIRAGSVELAVVVGEPDSKKSSALRLWDERYWTERLETWLDEDRGVTVMRLGVTPEVAMSVLERLGPDDLVARVNRELWVARPNASEAESHRLAVDAGVRDIGVAHADHGEVAPLLERAQPHSANPSRHHQPQEPRTSQREDPPAPPATMSLREEMAALERRRILEALDRHATQTEAAKSLGIPLRTFLNRLDALGIPRARKK